MVIQIVEIEIGKELARQVADGNSHGPIDRREEVVAGKVMGLTVSSRRSIDDAIGQVQDAQVCDPSPQLFLQKVVIDRREVLAHVHFQGIPIGLRPGLIAVHRRMDPLAVAAGVRILDKRPVERPFDHVHDGMVHNPVAKRRCRDDARLALVDREQTILAWAIRPVLKLTPQAQQFALQIQAELRDGDTAPFATARLPIRVE